MACDKGTAIKLDKFFKEYVAFDQVYHEIRMADISNIQHKLQITKSKEFNFDFDIIKTLNNLATAQQNRASSGAGLNKLKLLRKELQELAVRKIRRMTKKQLVAFLDGSKTATVV